MHRRRWKGAGPGPCGLGLLIAVLPAVPAMAHPHVWVTAASSVVFDKGQITAIDQKWTFDELYTAMAVQGLDANGDGKFDRQELAELAKVNMEGLKEFDYFSYARLAGADIKFTEAKDAWLEHKNGILALHFRLPLVQPVPATATSGDGKGFFYQTYDPSFFIAFELAKQDPVKLADGAPPGCRVTAGVPAAEAAEAKRLGEAFGAQLRGTGMGGMAKTIAVICEGAK